MPPLSRKPRGRIVPTRRELQHELEFVRAENTQLREQISRLRAGLATLPELKELHCPVCPLTCPHDWDHPCTCGQHRLVRHEGEVYCETCEAWVRTPHRVHTRPEVS